MSSRLLISAAHKSSGKTMVSIGLCAALSKRGHAVQPFKKGPDYIDPMWLSQASGRACRNLDLYLMERADIIATFMRHGREVNLVEGNKGLYDGLALDGSNSNAALAKLLDLPVFLVIDARGMTRGIAPLILGYQAFDRDVNIAGVILNNLGGSRHEAKLRSVIEHYTDVPVIGAVHHDERLSIVERHLGLMPSNESHVATAKIKQIGDAIAEQIDLDKLLVLSTRPALPLSCREMAGERVEVTSNAATSTPILTFPDGTTSQSTKPASGQVAGYLQGGKNKEVRIGIARDRAFGFYYADDLDALEAAGAELVPFDALRDEHLPEVDALYIGGGFPETCAAELEANVTLRREIKQAIEKGMPAYAECGGLMYLSRGIEYQGHSYQMVGAIPGDVKMHDKPIGRGYVHLKEDETHPWPRPEPSPKKFPPIQISLAALSPYASGESAARGVKPGERENQSIIFAHEFHYSSLENLPPDTRFAYHVARGYGIDGNRDGLVLHNLLASYTHLRTIGSCYWATRFVAFIRRQKEQQRDSDLTSSNEIAL
jgi:cobyrinic acid a,c-diamide synthase